MLVCIYVENLIDKLILRTKYINYGKYYLQIIHKLLHDTILDCHKL